MARPNASDPTPARDPRARQLLADARIACVASTYHFDLVGSMVAAARDHLLAAGLPATNFLEYTVPGAFELPLATQRLAQRDDIDAVLTFGLVLKGETEHDRYIAGAVSQALSTIGLESDTPVLFGLLTCNTLAQASERAKRVAEGGLDKGREVAEAAIGVLCTLDQIGNTGGPRERADRPAAGEAQDASEQGASR